MRTSIATVCLSGTLAEKMRAAADAGFDGIEIFEQDLVVSPHTPAQIRRRAAELGLSLDLYQPFRDLDGVEEDVFRDGLRRLEAKLGVAQELGIDTMLLCTNVGTATVDDDGLCADQLRRAGDLAAEYGIRLAYEALAWGRFVNDFEHAARIVRMADHPNVGTCLDSFHILSRGWDPAPIEDLDAQTVLFVQLADAPLLSMDVLSWSRHHRVFPGQGGFDLVDFMVHLHRCGYDGPVSLEIFNDSFRQADVARTAVDGLRSLRWLEDRTLARLVELGEADPGDVLVQGREEAIGTADGAGRSDGSGPTGAGPLELRALPPAVQPEDWGFVELRTGRLGETSRVLHQLGFALGGHHRSKEGVQLWTQGEARVVVADLGPTGQGAGLAGLAFEVPDIEAADARAHLLGARRVERSRRSDEQDLRGVFAPDGTEIFFCPQEEGQVPSWALEFGLEASQGPAQQGPGITGIDHVNTAQPWQHRDEAVLFFTALLGLQAQEPQDVPGPAGLVRSQVMRSSDDSIRMPLNVAPEDAEQSASMGAVYPEHVAFACRDIEGVARRAAQRGLDRLPVPANYYADLQARFGLDDDRVAELRELGLLYDRDDSGELLHFYTGTLGGVFFEVLERLGGYRGYGAADAPVRLAAQYRRLRDAARGIPR